MIPASDRKIAVTLIDEAIQNGARQFMACRELNISERTFSRWKNPLTPLEDQRPGAVRPTPSNKLTPAKAIGACHQLINIYTGENILQQ